MIRSVRIRGAGTASWQGEAEAVSRSPFDERLSPRLTELAGRGIRFRLFCPAEEAALLAAWDALTVSEIPVPVGGEAVRLLLGLDEAIDGIKARHSEAVSREGPLGASPIWFPLTTPNAIAAQLSIALGLRGESHTICGGNLSGAQAIGMAAESIRNGCHGAALAGGVTWVEEVLLNALTRLGRSDRNPPRCAACLIVLTAGGGEGTRAETELAGYGDGFGDEGILTAAHAALGEAGIAPQDIVSLRISGTPDFGGSVQRLRRAGISAPAVLSPSAHLHSASFPMAVMEAAGSPGGPVLVAGTDCLGAAAAAVVRDSS